MDSQEPLEPAEPTGPAPKQPAAGTASTPAGSPAAGPSAGPTLQTPAAGPPQTGPSPYGPPAGGGPAPASGPPGPPSGPPGPAAWPQSGPPGPIPPGGPGGLGNSAWWAEQIGRMRRVREGKIIAGVCGGLGRATGTDPLMFRVLLAVLVFFGGVGGLLYLAAWLVLPADGDETSPLEGLLGRGRSGTSPLLTVGLLVGSVLLLAATLGSGVQYPLLLIACVVAGYLLLRRNPGSPGLPPGPVPASGQPGAVPWAATAFAPTAAAPGTVPAPAPTGSGVPPMSPVPPGATVPPEAPQSGSSPSGSPSSPEPGVPAGPAGPAGPASAPPGQAAPPPWQTGPAGPATQTGYPPSYSPVGQPGAGYPGYVDPGAYTPPFAPHGPWGPAAATPAPVVPVPGRTPRRKRERSKLGRLTLSLVCVALALLAIIDVSGASIPAAGYIGVALAVVALGLLTGVRFGRARWLIVPGLLLTLALAASSVDPDGYNGGGTDQTVAPMTVAGISPRYEHGAGDFTLDLRNVDFAKVDKAITVKQGFGDLTILLPPDVDAEVDWKIGAGDARILGDSSDGVGRSQVTTDFGRNGPDDSHLLLDINLGAGDLEVSR